MHPCTVRPDPQDMVVLARRGVWARERTLQLLDAAADTAARLPPTPLNDRANDVGQAAAAAAAGERHSAQFCLRI